MRTFLRNITLPLVALLTLSACETDVEFSGEHTEPQMVVYSVVTAGEPIEVYVSRSRFFLDGGTPSAVRSARVEIWVNGTLAEQLVESEENTSGYIISNHFTSTTACHSGDRVEIRVSSPEFEAAAVGTTTIPTEPLLGDLSASITGASEDEVFANGMLYCEISDPAEVANYYWFVGMLSDVEHPRFDWVTYTDIVFGGGTTDGILGDIIEEEYREYALFDDALINGKTNYPLTMEWDHNTSHFSHTNFRVECWQVDEHFYKYFRSVELSADGAMFGEPVQVHSNIVGGIGLVASRSVSAIRELPCSEVE